MNPFEYQNPTRIVFGDGSLSKLSDEVIKYGKRPMLVCGSTIKNNGILERITFELEKRGIEYILMSDVSRPHLDVLETGIALARNKQADIIIGIGGGVNIDIAKAIALGAPNEQPVWDILQGHIPLESLKVLPIGTIVTVPGSGSEMDGNIEIDDPQTGMHGSVGSFVHTYPTFSILDPGLTRNLPFELTAYHGVTILVQVLEQYFGGRHETPIQDGLIETVARSVINALYTLKEDPTDLDARSVLMWASALTTNRILGRGKSAPWLGGPLGGLIDDAAGISYSQGIAITFPKYLMTCWKDDVKQFRLFAKNVMDIEVGSCEEMARKGAEQFQRVLLDFGIANSLKDLGKDLVDQDICKERMIKLSHRKLISMEDLKTIVSLSIDGTVPGCLD